MSRFGPLVDIDTTAYLHDSAQIYGKVRLDAEVSVWPNVVIRAEAREVTIGRCSNLQDFVMIHVGAATDTQIGAYCSIAHRATVHGATLGDQCLVGINATLMDGVVLGENSIVAAHCVVPRNMRVPANSVVAGIPGKVIASRNNWVANRFNALLYARNAAAYRRGEHRAWDEASEPWQTETLAKLNVEFARIAAGFP
ncbi:MAG: gamma carbonic anhydrase family protein [Alphaproteobacteria bacterium]|nr:gamma carbonic anhydrase family protein [Alphaproteobacteria bacterium]